MSDLLKEALADAKAVRATALANAKVALEEAFGERVQAMFAERLKNEVAADESVDTSGIGHEHGNVPGKQHPVKPHHQDKTVKGSQKFDAHLEEEGHHTEDPGHDGHMGGSAEEETISDAELEEIIAELEKDASMSEEEGAAPTDPAAPAPAPVDPNAMAPAPAAPVSDTPVPSPVSDTPVPSPAPAPAAPAASMDPNAPVQPPAPAPAPEAPVAEEDNMEEISLDELLAELEKEEGEEEIKEEASAEEEEEGSKEESAWEEQIAEVTAQRDQAMKTVEILRNQINEVNLLNAKLLYTNKLFKQFSLNNEQKMKVVENFDLTTSVREVKLTYAIMAESFNLGGSVVKKKNTTATTITEGLASKAVASTKPSQPIVAGGNQMAERFKTLAGIKK